MPWTVSPNSHQEVLLTVTSFMILKISAGVWTVSPNSPMYRFSGELCFRPSLCSQCSMAQVLLAKVSTPPDTLSPGELDYNPPFTRLSHGHPNSFPSRVYYSNFYTTISLSLLANLPPLPAPSSFPAHSSQSYTINTPPIG